MRSQAQVQCHLCSFASSHGLMICIEKVYHIGGLAAGNARLCDCLLARGAAYCPGCALDSVP